MLPNHIGDGFDLVLGQFCITMHHSIDSDLNVGTRKAKQTCGKDVRFSLA